MKFVERKNMGTLLWLHSRRYFAHLFPSVFLWHSALEAKNSSDNTNHPIISAPICNLAAAEGGGGGFLL